MGSIEGSGSGSWEHKDPEAHRGRHRSEVVGTEDSGKIWETW